MRPYSTAEIVSGVEPESCKSLGECHGYIHWDEMLCAEGGGMYPPPYKAGRCTNCGSFHIECGNCGEVACYEEEPIVKCDGCETKWELAFDKGELIQVRQLESEQ